MAQYALYANGAFISEDLYNKYNEILALCGQQLNAFQRRYNVLYFASQEKKESYTDKEYERTTTIKEKWLKFTTFGRENISKLDVLHSHASHNGKDKTNHGQNAHGTRKHYGYEHR